MRPGGGEAEWEGAPRPGADPFTRFPHRMIDHLLPRVTPAEWKIISVIARETYGWNRTEAPLSLRELARRTHLSKAGVEKALAALRERRVVVAEPRWDVGTGATTATLYRFRFDDE